MVHDPEAFVAYELKQLSNSVIVQARFQRVGGREVREPRAFGNLIRDREADQTDHRILIRSPPARLTRFLVYELRTEASTVPAEPDTLGAVVGFSEGADSGSQPLLVTSKADEGLTSILVEVLVHGNFLHSPIILSKVTTKLRHKALRSITDIPQIDERNIVI